MSASWSRRFVKHEKHKYIVVEKVYFLARARNPNMQKSILWLSRVASWSEGIVSHMQVETQNYWKFPYYK